MKITFKDFIGSNFFYSFSHSPVAICSFLIAASLIFCAIIAPVIAPYSPYDPATLNLMNGFSAPLKTNEFTGDTFVFGADDQGRDIFSTILYGMRISLFVGFSAVLFAVSYTHLTLPTICSV